MTKKLYILSIIAFLSVPFVARAATTWTNPTDGTIPVNIAVTGASFATNYLCLGLKIDGDSDLDTQGPWNISEQRCYTGGTGPDGNCDVTIEAGDIVRLYAWNAPDSTCNDVLSWSADNDHIFTVDPAITIGEEEPPPTGDDFGATSTQILVAIKDLGNMYALGSAATLAVVAALFFAKVWK